MLIIPVIVGLTIAFGILVLSLKVPSLALGPPLFGTIFFLIITRGLGAEGGAMYTMLGLLVLSLVVYALGRPGTLRRVTVPEVATVAMGVLMLVSLPRTGAPVYGGDKVLRLFGWMLPLLVAARVFSSTQRDTERMLNALSFLGALTMLFYMLLYVTAREYMMMGHRFGYLSLSWSCAICIALSVYPLFYGSLWRKVLAVVADLCGVFVMVEHGGRGAFYGIVIAVLLAFLSRRGLIRFGLIAVPLIVAAYVAKGYLANPEMRERLTMLDPISRIPLWHAGVKQFVLNPLFGGGVGSFAVFFRHVDIPTWPHNIWLEAGAELGILGLACMLVSLGFAIRPLLRLRRVTGRGLGLSKTLQLLFWIGVMKGMTTDDIVAQHGLFAMFGIMSSVRRWLVPLPAGAPEAGYLAEYGAEALPVGPEVFGQLPTG